MWRGADGNDIERGTICVAKRSFPSFSLATHTHPYPTAIIIIIIIIISRVVTYTSVRCVL